MKSKLFLGIILIITIISSMLMTVTEGACNYNDGGGIGGSKGSSGAPVTNRTSEACGEAGIYENAERLKQVEYKLNELKKISAKVNQGIGMNGNRKGIFDNLRMSKELASAGGDGDGSDENPACDKYPSACGSDNGGFPTIPTDANYQASLRG